MRTRPKKEVDCHTKAVIDALARFERGHGHSIFICSRLDLHEHMDKARVFLAGKYPVLAPYAMQQVTLGNGANGRGLGFRISYYTREQLEPDCAMLRGLEAHITILPDAMLAHFSSTRVIDTLNEMIATRNPRYEG